ncbi:MAG: Phosphoribosyltransferase [Candidatus Curtissbacteria bacterium GW2011_GWA1_40_9]|uniref:Phosphoribosyltransferase n=1 Tax=Candidatus Curtissbacteria bacterium GW2011_GWA1_40_9 TaxID=1618408 RepID=A0A0G0TLQ5_9BACT|nr:MAG: Phosphoribosyltransferase [Candidatus Curtissbacteria bacterium GW2011_GWA1_40_9]
MNCELLTMNFLDFLFPKKCVWCGDIGSYICESCQRKIVFVENPVCPVCQRQAVGGKTHPRCMTKYGLDGLVVAFRYVGPVKMGIKKIKYKWVWDIAEFIVDLFSKTIWKFSMPGDFTLVPIPLHVRRGRWRGFNQAELICRILAKRFGVGWEDLLVRGVETKTQVGLTRSERRVNVRGAFEVSRSVVNGRDYMLVDDVFTTGATMAEACKMLKRAGAREVWGMAVALG